MDILKKLSQSGRWAMGNFKILKEKNNHFSNNFCVALESLIIILIKKKLIFFTACQEYT